MKMRIIPRAAKITAAIVYLFTLFFLVVMLISEHAPEPALVLLPILLPPIPAVYVLLVGFVYGDARRRGMRYVMWMWLAILVPNFIGIILYFILRDPLPVFCSKCGAMTRRNFAYCPSCGSGVAPACSKCDRVLQPEWTHCPYCGTSAGPGRAPAMARSPVQADNGPGLPAGGG